jgi:hypothetical protein
MPISCWMNHHLREPQGNSNTSFQTHVLIRRSIRRTPFCKHPPDAWPVRLPCWWMDFVERTSCLALATKALAHPCSAPPLYVFPNPQSPSPSPPVSSRLPSWNRLSRSLSDHLCPMCKILQTSAHEISSLAEIIAGLFLFPPLSCPPLLLPSLFISLRQPSHDPTAEEAAYSHEDNRRHPTIVARYQPPCAKTPGEIALQQGQTLEATNSLDIYAASCVVLWFGFLGLRHCRHPALPKYLLPPSSTPRP